MKYIFLLLPLLFLSCSAGTGKASPNQTGLMEVSKISLPSVQGPARKLSDFRGKVTLLHFFSSWCAECGPEATTLSNLHKDFENSGFAVVGIAVDDDPFDLQKFVTQHNANFPIMIDTGDDFRQFFQVREIPMTLILDKTGKPFSFQDPDTGAVTSQIIGARRWDTAKPVELVARLVEGR